MVVKSCNLYITATGTITVQLDKTYNEQISAFALLTENRHFGREQHKLELIPGEKVSINLPAGTYFIVIFANGYEPYRKYINLAVGEEIAISANLKRIQTKLPSFSERVEKYNINLQDTSIHNLKIRQGEKLKLDPSSQNLKSSTSSKSKDLSIM